MAAVLQYELAVVGLEKLMRAFNAVDRRAARSAEAQAKAQSKAQEKAAKRAAAMSGAGGKAAVAGTSVTPAQEARAAAQAARMAAREAAAKQRAAAAVAASERRRIARAQADRLRIESSAAKKAADAKAKAEMQATRDATRQAQARAKSDTLAAARAAAQRQKIDERSAKVTERIRARGAERHARLEKAMAERAGRQAAFQAAQRREAIRGGVTTGANIVAGAGTAALAAVGAAVYKEVDIDRNVRQLLVAGRQPGQELAMSPEELRKRVGASAQRTGAAEGDVVAGLAAFVQRTGDLGAALEGMDALGTIATATGSDVQSVGFVMAELMSKMGLKGKEAADAMGILAVQGKKGSFELSDMAEQFPQMLADARATGLKGGVQGVRDIGAIAQIVRSGVGNADVAKTAVGAMFRQIKAKGSLIETGMTGKRLRPGSRRRGKGEAASVFEYDSQGNATAVKDPVMALVNTIDVMGGDITKLQDFFGSEGMMGASTLARIYNEGGGKTGGGRKALEAAFKDFQATEGSYAELQKDAALIQESASVKFQQAVERLQQALASPEMMEAAIQLADAAKMLAPALSGFSKDLARILNPEGAAERDSSDAATSAISLLDKASAIRVRARAMAKDGLDVGEKKQIMGEFAALRSDRDKLIGLGGYDEATQKEFEAERGAALGGMTRSQYDALSEQQKLDIQTSAQIASASIAGAIIEAVNNAASKVGNRGSTAGAGAPSRSATAT